MIPTLWRIYWTSLRRDRVAQAMTFLLPVMFFSIFALVFGGRARGGMSPVTVAVADEDRSETSRRLILALQREPSLRVRTMARPVGAPTDAPEVTLDRARAEALVKSGELSVALVVPAGFDTSFARFDGRGRAITMLTDPSDPVAPQVVAGLLQKAAMTAAPDLLAKNGIGTFERYAGRLTPEQRRVVDSWLPKLRAESLGEPGGSGGDSAAAGAGASEGAAPGGRPAGSGGAARDVAAPGGDDMLARLLPVEHVEVVGDKRDDHMISFYAAGIAVMFLLFSASSASGALLDEVDSGTLERVLGSNVGMTGLLAGKWSYVTLLGILQIGVMFVWARVAFRLDLVPHLLGFAVMTVVSAAAVAAFGLLLATLCRTRQQLGGIATIVILSISAIGGSMFPRPFMPEAMQRMGSFLFNAWALDGYVSVFWRNASVPELWPHVLKLVTFTAAVLAAARLTARRWERA